MELDELARCAFGKQLLGGGASDNGGNLLLDGPVIEGTAVDNIWEGATAFHNESGGAVVNTLTVVAYCANVSS